MKKTIALFIAILAIISLVACDDTTSNDIKEPSKVSNKDSQTTVDESGDNVKETATISKTVLLDESGVKITAKSLNEKEFFGAELKLLIENNSGKDLTVQARNASVNGYMVGTMMSANVVNEKKVNDSLTFLQSDLEACGITDIADMEFSFYIFSTDDWETYLETEQFQLKTSIADTHQYTFDDSGDMAYDENGIKIIVKGLSEDSSIFGPSVVVYIENNTQNAITVQTRDTSINGFMIGNIFSCDVMPGKKAIDNITFSDADLEENEITSIENIELSFHIFNSDSWDTIVDTPAVTINF